MKEIFIIPVLLIVIAVGGNNIIELFNSPKLPSPIIKVGNINIPTGQASYCLNEFTNLQCEDIFFPPDIIKHDHLKTVVVSPEAKLNIAFTEKPKKDSLNANIWFSDSNIRNGNLKGNTLIVPKEQGVYIYNVHAEWEKRSSNYVFAIEIQ